MKKTRKMFLLTPIYGMLMMEKYNLIFFFFNNFDASVTWTFLPHYKRYHENTFQTAEESFVSVKADFYELTIILIRF